jgi:uncharacterized protein HemX
VTRDFDAQLLESVAVRRRRLRDALLWGTMRTRRAATNLTGRLVAGAAVAAVICAGCVGWSFLQDQLQQRADQQRQQNAAAVAGSTR